MYIYNLDININIYIFNKIKKIAITLEILLKYVML